MAGIENYNVTLYTSVLPPEAVELPLLPKIHHGSVLEGIIAIRHRTTRDMTRGFDLISTASARSEMKGSTGSRLGFLCGFACRSTYDSDRMYVRHDPYDVCVRQNLQRML